MAGRARGSEFCLFGGGEFVDFVREGDGLWGGCRVDVSELGVSSWNAASGWPRRCWMRMMLR
jgi:hypothetical protein